MLYLDPDNVQPAQILPGVTWVIWEKKEIKAVF